MHSHQRSWLAALIFTVVCCQFFPLAFAQDPEAKIDPAFAAWYHPGATSPGSSTSWNKLHQTILVTSDDVNKVEHHYRKLAHDPTARLRDDASPPPFGIHTSKGFPHPKDDTKQIVLKTGDDSKTETDGETRGVTIRTLVYDTTDELVSVTISRTKTEKTTHIVLLCLQKK